MNNPPAFPATADLGDRVRVYKGMTLRDYFAAKAMQGLISSHWCEEARVIAPKFGVEELATDAFKMADALLKAREQ
jgi:hypothetical protein